MNGPQHLKEAERLAAVAVALLADKKSDPMPTIELGKLHALLAATAATVDCGPPCGNATLWAQVLT